MTKREEDVARVAREIESYLSSRPDGADDIEGVRTWWIARQRFVESYSLVKAALQKLEAEGHIEHLTGPDGRAVYRKRRDG